MLPRVLLADDHAAVRNQVSGLLASRFDIVAKVADGGSLVEAVTRLHPDLLVLDISMPVLNGIEAACKLREAGSQARIVFLTVHEEPEFVEAAMAAGARGYVFKSRLATDLLPAIQSALADTPYVSPRSFGGSPETQ
jgi:DNA-binding NarL/FixJ family response regulator